MKELQSDPSLVILSASKGRSTVIPNHEDYLKKSMDHINNGNQDIETITGSEGQRVHW